MGLGRRARLAAALLACAPLTGCGGQGAAPTGNGEAPFAGGNLLLVTVDTLRADHLGAYGAAEKVTPNLDSLAERGVRFTHCYAPVPLTLPSHTVMFTGRPPFDTGVRINGIHFVDEKETTLAERFRHAGYTTGAVISAYVMVSKFGLAQGFDHYDDRLTMDNVYRFYAEIPADEAVDRFRSWLDGLPAQQPFFGWLHLFDPHQPYAPPQPWADRFPDDPYRGEVAFVDEQVGRLMEHLERSGRASETLVVVTSDHGEGFGEHGEHGHGLLAYDETLRVPLIFHAPGRLRERTVEARVSLYDLTPTLAELFDLERDPSSAGRSLAPTLLAGETPPPAEIYFETLAGSESKGWAPLTGLMAGDLKYIRVPDAELYDLATDPGESQNLWRRSRQSAREMEQRLRRYVVAETRGDDARRERELTPEDRRQLAALGYLESSGARGDGALDPKRGIAIENRGREIRTAVLDGEWEMAESALTKLRRANPNVESSDFYELEFLIAKARGDRDAALAALERGVDAFPDVESLGLRLATYREEIGDLEGAARDARRLLARNARLSQAHSLLGLVAEKQGDPHSALDHFAKALELEPGSVPLRAKMAELALRTGQTPRARALYDALLEEGVLDDSPEQLARSAMLDAVLGNLPRAEHTLRRVVKLEPTGMHHLSLGIILVRQGKLEEAQTEIEAALDTDHKPLEPEQRMLARETLARIRGA